MKERTSNFQFIKEVLGICLSAPKKDKKSLIGVVVLFAIAAILGASFPVICATIFRHLQESMSMEVLGFALIAWTLVYGIVYQLSDWFFIAGESFMEVVFRRYNTVFCQNKTKEFLMMPPLLLNSEFRQKAVSLIPRLGAHGENMVYNLINFIRSCCNFIFSLILLIGFFPLLSWVILLLAIISCRVNAWINKKLQVNMDSVLSAETQIDTNRQDMLENAANIRSLSLEQKTLNDLQNAYEKFHTENYKYREKDVLLRLIPEIFNMLIRLAIIFISIRLAFTRQDIGTYVALTGLGFDSLSYLSRISMQFKWFNLNGMEYINLEKEMRYDDSLMPITGKSKLSTIKEIALDKICFTYPEEKSPVLDNLSLRIKAGSRVAIIGNSGMGKSTLINVMQHAYEIQSGKVLYNGKNVQGISQESLRDNLTYIDQHPTFWSQKTIKENLLMFNPKATDAELYQALKSANLLDEITQKEKGIDSKVTALSAGQKQRLSLARALLRHTPLIIMDEPTANLDTHAQTKVLQGIKNLSKVKGQKPTVIFASNVPAEIASANRILLLENGQIVEDGSPKKLMTNESSKTYKRLKKYKALFVD